MTLNGEHHYYYPKVHEIMSSYKQEQLEGFAEAHPDEPVIELAKVIDIGHLAALRVMPDCKFIDIPEPPDLAA